MSPKKTLHHKECQVPEDILVLGSLSSHAMPPPPPHPQPQGMLQGLPNALYFLYLPSSPLASHSSPPSSHILTQQHKNASCGTLCHFLLGLRKTSQHTSHPALSPSSPGHTLEGTACHSQLPSSDKFYCQPSAKTFSTSCCTLFQRKQLILVESIEKFINQLA